MIVEIILILLMLAFLIYWYIKHPDSKAVTILYEKELIEKQLKSDHSEEDNGIIIINTL
jgi:hypothetical protein